MKKKEVREHEKAVEETTPILVDDKTEEILLDDKAEEKTVIVKQDFNKFDKSTWKPKTDLGKKVKSGEIKTMDEVLEKGYRVLEAEIVDALVNNLEVDLMSIGQSKGKFGGGKKSIWRQTQKKTKEGNKPRFATMAVVGDRNGFVGIGFGKGKETVPAREKAIRRAKLNLIKVKMGCGSWECGCGGKHTIPFSIIGKEASAKIMLIPAPKGTGLVVEKEGRRMLNLAGLKDIYSKNLGSTRVRLNMACAYFDALKKLNSVKVGEK